MRSAGSRVSLATMAIASSAAARSCASKSGGTYPASITGVVGSTLIRRTMPPASLTIISALAMAGLASSTSERSIGTRMRLYMAQVRAAENSFSGGGDQARTDETFEPAGMRMQQPPIAEGKVDDDQPGGRQFFGDALARLDVAGGDERDREIVNARIVADHEQRARHARLRQHIYELVGAGVIDPLIGVRLRRLGEGPGQQFPGRLRAFRRGDQREIRQQAVAHHIGADERRVGAAALGQLAVAVALAGFGTFGLGMAQQHQAAHGGNVAFRAAQV